ncbi:capsid protein [Xanthomonas sacchari]
MDDYSSILTGLAATSGVAAIIGAGAIKAAPGFARWLTNKVATFFR